MTRSTFYVDMLKKSGPPGSSANSFNEILALYNEGKCGMWVDATIAASFITDPKQSKVADKVAFAQAPSQVDVQGRELAVGLGAGGAGEHEERGRGAEVRQLGDVQGVHPAGGQGRGLGARADRHAQVDVRERRSSRRPPSFAAAEKAAIDSANPLDSTLPKSPYTGVQFATIPEFQSIGVTVGQQMSAALAGKETVDAALKASQVAADREMKKAGYYK